MIKVVLVLKSNPDMKWKNERYKFAFGADIWNGSRYEVGLKSAVIKGITA